MIKLLANQYQKFKALAKNI